MTSLVGCAGEDFASILRSLGYVSVKRPGPAADMSLLLVDDDKPFLTRLARAMEGRGYAVRIADSVAAGIAAVEEAAPRP